MIPTLSKRLRSSRPSRSALRIAAAATAATCGPAAAQTPPPQLPPTREEVSRNEIERQQNRALRLDVEGGIERAPCALDSPQFANIRFTLAGVEFQGLQSVPAEELRDSYAPMLHTEQPISVVCSIRDRAAAILRDQGYIAAVEVPEQRIEDGVVRFRVILARLTQVRVRGNAKGAEPVIAGFLKQLQEQPVFNRREAERYLLLASDLPGYSVRLTLRPAGKEPGEVIGDVTVQRTPVYADVTIQDGGSKELGRWGAYARTQIFGLTGRADRTTLASFLTADLKEQQTVQLGHDFVLGSEGLRLGGLFTYAWANPTIPGDSEVKARTLLATLQADYPLVRTLGRTVRTTAGLDVVNQDVEFNGNPLSRDRLRVGFLRLGLDATSTDFVGGRSHAEPRWRVNGLVEVRKGLDLLGATDSCGGSLAGCSGPVPPTRLLGVSTAAVVRTLLYGEYRPVPKLTFALTARGQYAWKPLLSFEQFAAGNYTAGRGYDPGTLLGDRGWGTQAEIRVGSTIPMSPKKPAAETYLFFDQARVSEVDGLLTPGTNHLYSAGAGLRVTFDRFVLDGALAVPLTHVGLADKKPPPRLLISLRTRLWPWQYR